MSLCDDVKLSVDLLSKFESSYHTNEEHIDYCDRREQDLLHEIEFNDLDLTYGHYLADELKKNRKTRREYKDENRKLKPVMKIFDKRKNLGDDFQDALERVKNEERQMENREYRQRATTAMQEALDEASEKGQ